MVNVRLVNLSHGKCEFGKYELQLFHGKSDSGKPVIWYKRASAGQTHLDGCELVELHSSLDHEPLANIRDDC